MKDNPPVLVRVWHEEGGRYSPGDPGGWRASGGGLSCGGNTPEQAIEEHKKFAHLNRKDTSDWTYEVGKWTQVWVPASGEKEAPDGGV